MVLFLLWFKKENLDLSQVKVCKEIEVDDHSIKWTFQRLCVPCVQFPFPLPKVERYAGIVWDDCWCKNHFDDKNQI